LRVISGQFRSRPIKSLPGYDIRPTSDRLRETLFNVLTAGNPAALENKVFVDLYAGTGAVGIEALSRGAANVYFVESSKKAANLIQQNLDSLSIMSNFEILREDVVSALRHLVQRNIISDIIFLDPPYRLEREYRVALDALATGGLLGGNTIVVAEHEKKFDPGKAVGTLHRYRTLQQGDAALSFYRQSHET